MTYGELKTKFQSRLNRRDITASQVEDFIKSAIQRAQRLLRTPASETTLETTVDGSWSGLTIPSDYLRFVTLMVDNGDELQRVSLTEARRASRSPGTPRVFARDRDEFVIGPAPLLGSVITLVYHEDFAVLSGNTDTNWLTEVAPDVILNGALSDACDHFTDPRKQTFEDNFVKSIVDLNQVASDDELTNSFVRPSHSFDFGDEI